MLARAPALRPTCLLRTCIDHRSEHTSVVSVARSWMTPAVTAADPPRTLHETIPFVQGLFDARKTRSEDIASCITQLGERTRPLPSSATASLTRRRRHGPPMLLATPLPAVVSFPNRNRQPSSLRAIALDWELTRAAVPPYLPTYPTWMQTHRRWATLAFLTGQLRDRARTRVEARAGTFARYVPPRCFPAIQ